MVAITDSGHTKGPEPQWFRLVLAFSGDFGWCLLADDIFRLIGGEHRHGRGAAPPERA